jgi:hypothetical protein
MGHTVYLSILLVRTLSTMDGEFIIFTPKINLLEKMIHTMIILKDDEF